jgi:hypothetical protein
MRRRSCKSTWVADQIRTYIRRRSTRSASWWIDGCPSTAGGHNWPAMSFHRPSRQLVIPLSQSCISIRAREIEQVPGRGSAGGVAVTTGLGGGSPRLVPNLITPELQPPDRGHALYVFTLPDDR